MTTDSSRELFREFDGEKRTVSDSQRGLNAATEKLHFLFEKKRAAGQEIAAKLGMVKELRQERDVLTTTVKTHKEERKKIHDVLKRKKDSLRELREKYDGVKKIHKDAVSPAALEGLMKKMEFRVETEGMTFDAEQKIMKKIKELKKKLDETQELRTLWDQLKELRKEVQILISQSEMAHREVQGQAGKSQQKHERVMSLLREVDVLRTQEVEIEKEIQEQKKVCDGSRQGLEQELLKLGDLSKKINTVKSEGKRHREEKISFTLEQKTQNVEEKIKRREKLTTADLLAWQAKNK